ncbi:MAG: hypothetical protein KDC05_12915 [Bacteroidales bacterium]|nr:hypothetical protein [Bacteroidales bacterium]
MNFKAGYIQFCPDFCDPGKNIRKLDSLLKHAANADLIVIPELANSGYNFQTHDQAVKSAEDIPNGPFTRFLIGMAKKLDLYIVAGINEKDNGKLYNSAVLVGPEGFLGKYRKIHLFMNEFDFFEKGDAGLPVFQIKGVKVGMLICFDWVFPEVWRILAMKGTDIICHPSNLVLPYAQQAVPVHGMINRTYCITANRYGTEHHVTFSGKSVISDPLGKILCQAPEQQDEVKFIEFDLDLSKNKMITPKNHVFNDRRPEQYKGLV